MLFKITARAVRCVEHSHRVELDLFLHTLAKALSGWLSPHRSCHMDISNRTRFDIPNDSHARTYLAVIQTPDRQTCVHVSARSATCRHAHPHALSSRLTFWVLGHVVGVRSVKFNCVCGRIRKRGCTSAVANCITTLTARNCQFGFR